MLAEADVVSFTAVGGNVQCNEADINEDVTFLDIKADCVIDFEMPSGITFKGFKTLSPAKGPTASICQLFIVHKLQS